MKEDRQIIDQIVGRKILAILGDINQVFAIVRQSAGPDGLRENSQFMILFLGRPAMVIV